MITEQEIRDKLLLPSGIDNLQYEGGCYLGWELGNGVECCFAFRYNEIAFQRMYNPSYLKWSADMTVVELKDEEIVYDDDIIITSLEQAQALVDKDRKGVKTWDQSDEEQFGNWYYDRC